MAFLDIALGNDPFQDALGDDAEYGFPYFFGGDSVIKQNPSDLGEQAPTVIGGQRGFNPKLLKLPDRFGLNIRQASVKLLDQGIKSFPVSGGEKCNEDWIASSWSQSAQCLDLAPFGNGRKVT